MKLDSLSLEWRFSRAKWGGYDAHVYWLEYIINGKSLYNMAFPSTAAEIRRKRKSDNTRKRNNNGFSEVSVLLMEHDLSPNGWSQQSVNNSVCDSIELLLAKRPSLELRSGRVPLYICACGEVDCGSVCARIERHDELIEWRDFSWENWVDNCDPGVDQEDRFTYEDAVIWSGVGSFSFNYADYEACLLNFPSRPDVRKQVWV